MHQPEHLANSLEARGLFSLCLPDFVGETDLTLHSILQQVTTPVTNKIMTRLICATRKHRTGALAFVGGSRLCFGQPESRNAKSELGISRQSTPFGSLALEPHIKATPAERRTT